MATILVVEDDKHTRLLTCARLKPYYTVTEAENGEEALKLLDQMHIDLIIADIQMPVMNGYDMVKEMRESGIQIPVIMLTAMHTFDDKRTGFASGTDDYMIKPIDYEELLWRIKALLRRANIVSQRKIIIGDITLDSAAYTVRKEGTITELAKKEFDLLFKLLSYPGMIFTKSQLLDEIWGYDTNSDETTIKTHINRLRNKFADCTEFEIITIRGLGYKAEIYEK
ncbi:response regulator transcription factor [Clostridium boliviensis]|uniref:Heme response regulator HssR n=1 Tax=Clostridium boliviensis TaxID=318465 RepID=A0ABU4GI91_9CLOT|nr:response regulator transcription factor [Clostridium boliviensis]MDW2796710.1 response regulator transcription factor [Clostridium boliviensis]